MPNSGGIVPITGTIVEVAPDVCDVQDVIYPLVVIRKEDGTFQEFAPVHAIYEVAGLIEANAAGHFIFWRRPNEWRLAFCYRHNGARAVDFDAVREYLE
jgi:hypothetical protein